MAGPCDGLTGAARFRCLKQQRERGGNPVRSAASVLEAPPTATPRSRAVREALTPERMAADVPAARAALRPAPVAPDATLTPAPTARSLAEQEIDDRATAMRANPAAYGIETAGLDLEADVRRGIAGETDSPIIRATAEGQAGRFEDRADIDRATVRERVRQRAKALARGAAEVIPNAVDFASGVALSQGNNVGGALALRGVADGITEELDERLAPEGAFAREDALTGYAGALGSTVPYFVAGATGAATGGATLAPAAILGAVQNGGATFNEALDNGASGEVALSAMLAGSAIGAAEGVPISRGFGRLDALSGGFATRAIRNGIQEGAEEAVQETLSLLANDSVARALYDDDRRIGQALTEAAATGGGIGALLGVLTTVAGGRRRSGPMLPSGEALRESFADGARTTPLPDAQEAAPDPSAPRQPEAEPVAGVAPVGGVAGAAEGAPELEASGVADRIAAEALFAETEEERAAFAADYERATGQPLTPEVSEAAAERLLAGETAPETVAEVAPDVTPEAATEPAVASYTSGQDPAAYVAEAGARAREEADAERERLVFPEEYADRGRVDEQAYEADLIRAVAERGTSPLLLAETWQKAQEAEAREADPSTATSPVDAAIAANLGFVSSTETDQFGDLTKGQRTSYFRSPTGKAASEVRVMSERAAEISEASGVEVTPEDIRDFIQAYPNGTAQYMSAHREGRRLIEQRTRAVTGGPVTAERMGAILSAAAPVDVAPDVAPEAAPEPPVSATDTTVAPASSQRLEGRALLAAFDPQVEELGRGMVRWRSLRKDGTQDVSEGRRITLGDHGREFALLKAPEGYVPFTIYELRRGTSLGSGWKQSTLKKETAEKLTRTGGLDALIREIEDLAASQSAPEAAPEPRYGDANALVSRESYEAALAELGEIAPFSNPWADPRKWEAAVKVAAFHIEAGARTAADFASRVVADLGESIRPELDRLRADAEALATPRAPDVSGDGQMTGEPVLAPEASVSDTPQTEGESLTDLVSRLRQRQEAKRAEQAAQEAAGDAAMREAREDARGGSNAEVDRQRAALGLEALPAPQARRWSALLDAARHSVTDENGMQTPTLLDVVDAAAMAVEANPEQVPSAKDLGVTLPEGVNLSGQMLHVAFVVRLAELSDGYEADTNRATEMNNLGMFGTASVYRQRAFAKMEAIDRIHHAARARGSEAGRELNIRRAGLAADSFSLVQVLVKARENKEAPLTEGERATLEAAVQKLKAAEAKVARLEQAAANRERNRANKTVREASPKTTDAARERRRQAILQERGEIKNKIRALFGRANDAVGVTAEYLYLLGRLALSHAKEAKLTLEQIVERTREDVPEATAAHVIEALARPKIRPGAKGSEQNPYSDAELRRARLEARRAQVAVREAQRALVPPEKRSSRFEDVVNLPRTLMASGDLSAVGNQAAPMIRRHPVLAVRAFVDSLRNIREADAVEYDRVMRLDARFDVAEQAKLYVAPVGPEADIMTRERLEEQFKSRWIQKTGIGVRTAFGAAVGTLTMGPGVGTAVGATMGAASQTVIGLSENQFAVFLNALRTKAFYHYMDAHEAATMEELEGVARGINLLTGRGELNIMGDSLQSASNVLSLALFSPRLTFARFQAPLAALRPFYSKKSRTPADLALQRYAAHGIAQFVAFNMIALVLADIAGGDEVEVGWNPRDSSFGKIKAGQLRIDIWGGYSQTARLIGRGWLAGTDAYGVTETPKNRREIVPMDEVFRFINSKKAPWIGLGQALIIKKDFLGREISPRDVLAEATVPISLKEGFDATREDGAATGGAIFALNSLGIGTSLYENETASAEVEAVLHRGQWTPRAPAKGTFGLPDDLTEQEKEDVKKLHASALAEAIRADSARLEGLDAEALRERLSAMDGRARREASRLWRQRNRNR